MTFQRITKLERSGFAWRHFCINPSLTVYLTVTSPQDGRFEAIYGLSIIFRAHSIVSKEGDGTLFSLRPTNPLHSNFGSVIVSLRMCLKAIASGVD